MKVLARMVLDGTELNQDGREHVALVLNEAAEGRLVDREAIDYEAARMMLEPSYSADRSYWLRKAKLIVAAALGDPDE